ncbi:MAG: hypothetical protein MZV70_22450 [Desulfobacterales bacterium]|nr:hypothetical protein [Desulfobacterales bacterium]
MRNTRAGPAPDHREVPGLLHHQPQVQRAAPGKAPQEPPHARSRRTRPELLEDVEIDNRQAITMANIHSDILSGHDGRLRLGHLQQPQHRDEAPDRDLPGAHDTDLHRERLRDERAPALARQRERPLVRRGPLRLSARPGRRDSPDPGPQGRAQAPVPLCPPPWWPRPRASVPARPGGLAGPGAAGASLA